MWLLLLLATCAATDWVEIAQHQRPARPERRITFHRDGTTEANKIYSNYSLTKLPWHKGALPRVPNFGSVKRVQLHGSQQKKIFTVEELPKGALAGNILTGNREYENIRSVRGPNIKKKDKEKLGTEKNIHNVENFENKTETNEKGYHTSTYFDLQIEKANGKSSNISQANAEVYRKNKNQEIFVPHGTGSLAATIYEPAEINSSTKNKNADEQVEIENVTEKHRSSQGVKYDSTDPDQNEREDVNLESDTKPNAVEVILKLMKVVTDNISRSTRQSFKSKIRYLEDLRNNIVANIAERVEQVWPDDAQATRGTRARRTARGHVEFPSSESALMTISFLTFAVFLIKLVLVCDPRTIRQVIHTYKNKTMMVAPAVVAAVGRTAASLKEQTRP